MRSAKFILVIIITVLTCKLALATPEVIDLDPGVTPDQTIELNTLYSDGSFFDLSYYISSTGATSGIRYRTSAITVTIGGYKATFDCSALMGLTPKGGQSIYSQITISKQDLIDSIGKEHEDEINILLEKPVDNVIIGANIQIYNVATGVVLATITDREDVASVAGNIGFGQQDINDMKSRWQQDAVASPVQVKPMVNTEGLRPSVLVP